ncbi:shikimate dehydrogenase [Corynebacterium freiburgense]|uniref:shikimate dehydrogenase n=1 Tax=Corynebacterium freiburgense TaxID=556548 RepID=UPI00041682B1|nr:shikimate dehydrogenase [Corynebacterium freiburgense]WJZ02799.1 Shikimate dehydrogenase [Corynebacterium freiburgense]
MITHRAAVLGSPIAHSLSPVLHNAGYAALGLSHWEYGRRECTAEQLAGIVSNADSSYRGFSVTMPGKFAALQFADEATERARAIGSANTLVRVGEDVWKADNTDCDGIRGALAELGALTGTTAFVLGGGGTARPALWALVQAGYQKIIVFNRSDKTAELAPLVGDIDFAVHPLTESAIVSAGLADVIISTVPSRAIAGLEPTIAIAPILDVIYDPWPTPLICQAQQNNISAVGGHCMLAHQAFGQFEQFTGHKAPQVAMSQALRKAIQI